MLISKVNKLFFSFSLAVSLWAASFMIYKNIYYEKDCIDDSCPFSFIYEGAIYNSRF